MQAVGGEELEPAEAVVLVAAEFGLHGGWQLDCRQLAEVAQALAELGEGADGFGGIDRQRFGHAGGGEAVDPSGIATALEEVADLIDDFHQRLRGEADEAVFRLVARRQQEELGKLGRVGGREIAGDGVGDHRDEADLPAVDLVGDIEAEPVDTVVGFRFDRRDEIRHVVQGEATGGIHLDGPSGIVQLRELRSF